MQAKSVQFPVRDLAHLEEVAISFRMLWNAMPQGFSKSQLSGWSWLKDAFYAPSIKREYWGLSEKRKRLVDELLIDVEIILDDDTDEANPDRGDILKQGRFQFPDDATA